MAEGDDDIRSGASDDDEDDIGLSEEAEEQLSERNEELKDKPGVEKALLDILKDVEKGFSDQWERANAQMDYWDIYNCKLGPKQFYSGTSRVFVPLVHDAVNARVTRFVNQIFPPSGKHVEVTAGEDKPYAVMSLLEHYIRKCRLRTNVLPALCRNGDIEGQYNLYPYWARNERHVVKRVKRSMTVDELPIDTGEEHDDIEEEVIIHQQPWVEVIPDADVLVLPQTAQTIEQALDEGGSVTIIRRWGKAKIRKLIRDGEIDKEAGQQILAEMTGKDREKVPDKRKHLLDACGIKDEGPNKRLLAYETWTKLKIDGERRICKAHFGGEKLILSARRNPYWCDKVPLLSAAVMKVDGAFKGVSKITHVETYQYMANDAINEGMDSAAYALMPIVMTNPERNPRIDTMVLSVAAVWQTSPQDTQFAQFPQIWKDAFTIVSTAKDQVFQTLSVNPAMIPQAATGKKTNQAQIANEQQVDVLTTADAVTNLEGEILTPLLQWFLWLDHQYRDEVLTVESFGRMGIQAAMQRIEPVQMDRRYEFRWFGVEAARSAQQIQMQMAGLNVLRGIQPQYHPGYQIDLTPIIAQFVENTYGPRLAPLIFKSIKDQLSISAEFENQLLQAGMDLPVNPTDNDQEHMQEHAREMQEGGDMHGTIRQHIVRHQMQMQLKQQQQMMQQAQQQQGAQGSPGGAGPGVAGTPRPGGAAGGPRPQGQMPPGVIHQDRMGMGMPRLARG